MCEKNLMYSKIFAIANHNKKNLADFVNKLFIFYSFIKNYLVFSLFKKSRKK